MINTLVYIKYQRHS